jgi:pimeloyl-ACP methyl ester carboxylesterase
MARTLPRHRPLLSALLGILVVLAGVLALTRQRRVPMRLPRQRRMTMSSRPIVLVHGSLADASSWTDVVKRLQRDGYQVLAPPNPLRSLSGAPNTSGRSWPPCPVESSWSGTPTGAR